MTSQAPNARHSSTSTRFGVRLVLKTLAVVAAVAVVSGASLVAVAAFNIGTKISDNAIDIHYGSDSPPPEIGAYDGAFNLLIVGVDNDPDQTADDYGEREGSLNDVNLLLHVSADHTNAVAVSFPRDLVIAHPECTAENGDSYSAMSAAPINEAMGRGGLPCVVQTVEYLTDLPIQYAGYTTFDGVVQMTDAIGGVPICLTDRLIDDNIEFTGSDGIRQHLDLPAGVSEISGPTALGFLRSRHGVGDGSDIGRISSQQQYLSSLVRTVTSGSTLNDPVKLYNLATVAANTIKFSSSIGSVDTLISMAQTLRTIDLNNIVFVQYPGAAQGLDSSNFPGKVLPNQEAADELFALIAADQPIGVGAQGLGSTAEPVAPDAAPVDAAAEPTADDPAAGDPAAAEPVVPSGPTVVAGVTGQTANQQTCAVPNEN